jgi:Icc-related predicted phosphoesterase
VVLAGDLLGYKDGYATVEEAQRADAAEVVRVLEGIRQPLLYLMGNDDMVELDPKRTNLRSIHGQRVELGDINFVGYQYSLPFMAGVFEKSEEQIREDLTRIESLLDQRTVLVTHSPGYGVLDVVLGIGGMVEHAGGRAIADVIERRRPLLHIHGHIHQGFGHQGRYFNVAAAGHLRAVLIDTATLHHEIAEGEAV